jgi:hypothetical protein
VEWGAEHARFVLKNEAKQEVIGFDTGLIVDRYSGFIAGKSLLTQDEAAFTAENGMAAMRIIVLSANFNTIGIDRYENGEVYILLKIK